MYALGNHDVLGAVPACTIEDDDGVPVGTQLGDVGKVFQDGTHRRCIDGRTDKVHCFAGARTDE